MEFAKLILTPEWKSYTCTEASNIEMEILGRMFADDVRDTASSYKETIADNSLRAQSGNFIFMAKENDSVVLSDLYSEESEPTEFKISQQAFIRLLNDWQEKVCLHMPTELTIIYDTEHFIILDQKTN